MSKIIKESMTDSKLILKQKVSIDFDEFDEDDCEITNEDELFENFQEDLENIINSTNWSNYFNDEETEGLIKKVELIDLNNSYVEIHVQLSKQLNNDDLKLYFNDFINDLVSEMESQRMEFTVTNNYEDRFDPMSDYGHYQTSAPDSNGDELVYLKTEEVPQMSYDKFIEEAKEMNDTTREFFDLFDYESFYAPYLGRGANEYLHSTYTGKDIKLFDKYVENELKSGGLSLDDLSAWNDKWIDDAIINSRKFSSELTEGVKEGIERVLSMLGDKIYYKYQGEKKLKDGTYDRFVCRIKKAGIFDLVGFEDNLKKLGNKFGVLFKVTYPERNQDHSVFWVEGRMKNTIIDKNGNEFAYESKKLKEDYSDDQKKHYKDMFDECCNESTIGHKRITIDVVDTENNCIESLLRYIQKIASQGHSFPIFVDNESEWYHARFGFDGDGSDRILDIKVEKINEEGEE